MNIAAASRKHQKQCIYNDLVFAIHSVNNRGYTVDHIDLGGGRKVAIRVGREKGHYDVTFSDCEPRFSVTKYEIHGKRILRMLLTFARGSFMPAHDTKIDLDCNGKHRALTLHTFTPTRAKANYTLQSGGEAQTTVYQIIMQRLRYISKH